MKFSVIIPVYNAEKLLNRCLDSIVKQNFNDYEVILVDDGSTDQSGLICDDYSKKYSFIKTFHQKNSGPTAARKNACKEANGEYIICIDADDYIKEDYFSHIHDELCRFNPDVLVCDYYEQYENGEEIVKGNYVDKGIYEGDRKKRLLDEYIYDSKRKWINSGSMTFTLWSKIIRKSLFLKFQDTIPNNIIFGEDLLLSLKILNEAKRVYISPIKDYVYWINNDSIVHHFNHNILNRIDDVIPLLSNECEDKNKIAAYALSTLIAQMSLMSQFTTNYNDFKNNIEYIENCKNLWSYAVNAKIRKFRINDFLKAFLLKHKLNMFLYYVMKH